MACQGRSRALMGGNCLKKIAAGLMCALALTACGSSNKSTLPVSSAGTPGTAVPGPTVGPTRSARAPTRVALSRAYHRMLKSFCNGMQDHNGKVVASFLPYYQYNSGVRYGQMGDGAGQTGTPGLLRTWVRTGHIRCVDTGPDIAGHAVLLSRGWPQPGGWSLTEFDVYNGVWKINDFTFGDEKVLRDRMHVAGSPQGYHV